MYDTFISFSSASDKKASEFLDFRALASQSKATKKLSAETLAFLDDGRRKMEENLKFANRITTGSWFIMLINNRARFFVQELSESDFEDKEDIIKKAYWLILLKAEKNLGIKPNEIGYTYDNWCQFCFKELSKFKRSV